jgi:hypothetical protein
MTPRVTISFKRHAMVTTVAGKADVTTHFLYVYLVAGCVVKHSSARQELMQSRPVICSQDDPGILITIVHLPEQFATPAAWRQHHTVLIYQKALSDSRRYRLGVASPAAARDREVPHPMSPISFWPHYNLNPTGQSWPRERSQSKRECQSRRDTLAGAECRLPLRQPKASCANSRKLLGRLPVTLSISQLTEPT